MSDVLLPPPGSVAPLKEYLPPLVDSCEISLQVIEGAGSVVEGKKTGKVMARGEFARCGVPTENGRIYTKDLWKREIARLGEAMRDRKVTGTADHPDSGKTSIGKISHLVTDLKIEGDIVVGEAEILTETIEGRNLAALLKSKCKIGVSSRGFGTTRSDGDGHEIVQDDYKLVTFDFVAEPADNNAYPEVFLEGKGNKIMATSTDKSMRILEALMNEGEGFTADDAKTASIMHSNPKDPAAIQAMQTARQGVASKHPNEVVAGAYKASAGALAKHLDPKASEDEKNAAHTDAITTIHGALKHPDLNTDELANHKGHLISAIGQHQALGGTVPAAAGKEASAYKAPESAAAYSTTAAKHTDAKADADAGKAQIPASLADRVAHQVNKDVPVPPKPAPAKAPKEDDTEESVDHVVASEVMEAVAKLRPQVEAQVRQELLADPSVAAAKQVVEQILALVQPFTLSEEVVAVVHTQEAEIVALKEVVAERDARIVELETNLTAIGERAKQAGFNLFMEKTLSKKVENKELTTEDVARVRTAVGNVNDYKDLKSLKSKVEGLVEDQRKRRDRIKAQTEARNVELSRIESEKDLIKKESKEREDKLQAALDEATSIAKSLEVRLYAQEKTRGNPKQAKLTSVMESVRVKSKADVDQLLENLDSQDREDTESQDQLRARVRKLSGSKTRSYRPSDEERSLKEDKNYEGLGVDFDTIAKLAGI